MADFSYIKREFDPTLGRITTKWILELPGAGCQWFKKTGGCTMCGFSQATQKYTLGGRLWPHWFFMVLFYYAYWLVRKSHPEVLVIYNGGSFLCDKEIPAKTQLAIIKFARRHHLIQKVMVETRAEFVSEKKLTLYRDALGDSKYLEIAIGLESADDYIRNTILGKGMSRQIFERAIAICKEPGVLTFAYVFLKPEGLTEEEAIEDAVATIRYCHGLGVNEVALSCAFVQEGTSLCQSYRKGNFQPPKLWSVIKVVESTGLLMSVAIGGFSDEPPPIAVPSNCPDCNQVVMAAIQTYRENHQLSAFDGLQCDCK